MTGPLAPLFAQVREGMIYRRGGESTCLPVYPNCTCPDCLALRALSSIERHVQDMESERAELGPYFVRDVARLAGLPDDASMDWIYDTLRAALPAREKEEE